MLASAARQAGADVVRRPSVPDDPGQVLAVLEDAAGRADLLLTSGGVSMGGEHDVVKAALQKLGTVRFRKVAMQPGMPQGFGIVGRDSTPILTLPGNPVSAFVSFQLFGRPALRALQGSADGQPRTVRAALTGPVRSPAWQEVVPARRPGGRRWRGNAAVRPGITSAGGAGPGECADHRAGAGDWHAGGRASRGDLP